MVKARIPGSSQELYTVSVESVPQYAGGHAKRVGCCKSGRVGKDLLCGVLIALAVICAAVAIFLVVFYVVNGTDESQATPSGTDQQNGTLVDSSPLTRDREEDKKINSLMDVTHDWQTKDQLSLSSTSLPDVGIHEPEFHVNGEDIYSPYSRSTPGQQSSTTTTSSTEPPMDTDQLSPIVGEAKSQDMDGNSPTSLFIPDDDVIIETPSADLDEPVVVSFDPSSSTTVQTTTTVSTTEASSPSDDVSIDAVVSSSPAAAPVAVPETSGFVPVAANEEEAEQATDSQTESLAEILAVQPAADGPAVDSAPWKPIDVDPTQLPVATNRTDESIQGRFIVEDDAKPNEQSLSKDPEDIKPAETVVSTSVRPLNATTTTTTLEPEESTDFALMQNLGNMALLLPEDRVRTSSSGPSSSTERIVPAKVDGPSVAETQPQCIRRQLPFCRGILPYSETVLPNWVGDVNESERNFSVPYFEIIAESECHARMQQYACAVLEPPCRGNGISLPPCRQFCRAIAEDCSSYVLSALKLATVLDCDQFPQSNDPNVCLNLASTTPEGECLPNEYRCNSDNTCIPERWVCDGQLDCSQGDDEFSCSRCRDDEFRCESENRCLPKRWKCDGSRDCADGSDERDCPINQECGDGQFRCNDSLSCIPLRRVCDGSNHCRDNSDETNCTAIACQIEDFKCRDNGVCISRKWVCDGNEDCKDGSDEADCAREAELDFESDVLIEELQEQANATATGPETTFNPEKCPLGELLCMSGSTCIRFEQLCDGTRDCADGADETDCSKSPGSQ